jgi:DeoR family transcriptional regulator, ulaG and ulaABCDEF operon transcriptional repressor
MHSNQRETLILKLLGERGFISFQELEVLIKGSPATIRRDLERLSGEGKLTRVRGGAKSVNASAEPSNALASALHLAGVPFHENIARNRAQKEAIGRAAAALCAPGEGVMIDGGSTTLQMCPHLAGLNLQVLTNSLHIVSALINQAGTRILVPSGAVFPEQNIILSVFGDDGMPRFHAPKLFMGAASLGPQGLMQADVVLVAAERRLIERADEIILLVDASKFDGPSGNVVCGLEEIDVIITDDRVSGATAHMIEAAGARLVIAAPG